MNDFKQMLTDKIAEIVNLSDENTLYKLKEKAWINPIVGFASGSDALFSFFKEHIGDFYWTPDEVMEIEYEESFNADQLSIACWILPQTIETISDQRKETKLPSKRWVYSRHYGEAFNQYLRSEVVNYIRSLGIKAASALLTKGWDYKKSDNVGICSNWSERHTAYVAGMGTFGLSDGLITEKGKAHRIGTVIFEKTVKADKRTFKNHMENCLYYSKGTCGVCVKRCPAGAITKADGHDKQICHDYIRGVTKSYAFELLGEEQTPCGLCQAKVPCEMSNPMAKFRNS